jgi:hypothetical protein
VRVGVLRCDVAPGAGYIIGSQKTLDCRYKSVFGYRERYAGRISRVGLDVGFTQGGRLAWSVYAPSRRGPGALAGVYGGASAEATLAAGLGANALIGGMENSIALQPLSVSAQKGFDVAVGLSSLRLEAVQ